MSTEKFPLVTPADAQSTPMPPKVAAVSGAVGNLLKWIDAVRRGVVAEVRDLHSDDMDFLPTMSSKRYRNLAGVEEYHSHFTGRKGPDGEPLPPQGELIGDVNNVVSEDGSMAVLYGNYLFDRDTDREAMASYVFAYKKNEAGDWKIVHHHSASHAGGCFVATEGELPNEEILEASHLLSSDDGSLKLYVHQTDEGRYSALMQQDTPVLLQFSQPPGQNLSRRPKGPGLFSRLSALIPGRKD